MSMAALTRPEDSHPWSDKKGKLSEDKQSLLRAQIGADIDELTKQYEWLLQEHLAQHERLKALEQSCKQCYEESRGEGP